MCGIAGAFDLRGRRLFPRQSLLAMMRALAHRGPDGEGLFVAPGIAMAARRLALVDPAGGTQPVTSEDGDVVVTCNGELFERHALRAELLARGHRLRSRCDTELWPHLWEEARDPDELFRRAKGQFALALWDARDRRLLLARDRAGISPLYFAEQDGWLLWASEIKSLFASGLVTPRADPRGIDHVFSFFCAPARRTFFEGVTSLAPGEVLEAQGGARRIWRHSDLDFPRHGEEERPSRRRVDELVSSLDALLRSSIRARLDADAPVAAYLSGGVDSNILLALARAELGRAPDTFTIGFDGAGTDESRLAQEAAREHGSRLTVVRMSAGDIADALPALHVAAEGPVVDTSTACMMRLAAEASGAGFKAVLTGEGADEALAGYVWLRIEKALGCLDRGTAGCGSRALRRAVFGMVGGERGGPRGALGTLRTAQRDMYDPFARVRGDLYAPSLRAALADHDPYGELDLDVARMRHWHPLNRSLYVEYRVMLPGLLLQAKGDRAAMVSGVEARYPFLDDRVIDFCAGLAPDLKLRGLTGKWLLRRLAGHYLPARTAQRPKTMFRAKLSDVVLGPSARSWARQLVSPESLRKAGLFDPRAVARELRLQRLVPTMTPRRLVMNASLTAVVATQLWHHLLSGRGALRPSRVALAVMRRRPLPALAYAVIAGAPVAGAAWVLARGGAWAPVLAAVGAHALAAVVIVALERWRPFSRAWLVPRGDLHVDLTHLVVDGALAEITLRSLALLAVLAVPVAARVWPGSWPLALQLVAALVAFELVQYAAHRAMHHVAWLWPFHAVHHSPERLHVASTFRNHPVDSLLTVALPLAPLALLGASRDVLILTGVAVGVHSMVQHANIDFGGGAVDYVLSTARLHRWHHSRALAESEGNYGGTLILWDLVFGSRIAPDRTAHDDVGLSGQAEGEAFPATYVGQILYPLRRRRSR